MADGIDRIQRARVARAELITDLKTLLRAERETNMPRNPTHAVEGSADPA